MKLDDKLAPRGAFRVLDINMLDGTRLVEGDYSSKEEAFAAAKSKAKKEQESRPASAAEILYDVFYVYDDAGTFLGQG